MKRCLVLFLFLSVFFLFPFEAHAASSKKCPDCSTRMYPYEVPATCTQDGWLQYSCDNCGYWESKTYPAGGHSFTKQVSSKSPTYTSTGSITYQCSNCSQTKTVTVPMLECTSHVWVEFSRIDPTYTEEGSVTYQCSQCLRSKTEVLPVLVCTSHVWVEVSRIDPTFTTEGSVTYECSQCRTAKSEVLPLLDHVHQWAEAERTDPTEEAAGSVTYSCSCGQMRYEDLDYTSPVFDTTQELGSTFLSGVWKLFGVYVPGFSFTVGQMYLGIALCSISILVIRLFFGIGGGGGVSTRTGSTNNPKISSKRRNDEF